MPDHCLNWIQLGPYCSVAFEVLKTEFGVLDIEQANDADINIGMLFRALDCAKFIESIPAVSKWTTLGLGWWCGVVSIWTIGRHTPTSRWSSQWSSFGSSLNQKWATASFLLRSSLFNSWNWNSTKQVRFVESRKAVIQSETFVRPWAER